MPTITTVQILVGDPVIPPPPPPSPGTVISDTLIIPFIVSDG